MLAIAIVVVLVLVVVSVRKVPPGRAYVIDVLGRYRRTLGAGVHLVIPFVEATRARVDLGEQVARFPPQPTITLDNMVACIRTELHYRVVDPVLATYEVADYRRALEQLTITVLREIMGSTDLYAARSSRHELAARLTGALRENAGPWGIGVIRTEVTAVETGSREGCA